MKNLKIDMHVHLLEKGEKAVKVWKVVKEKNIDGMERIEISNDLAHDIENIAYGVFSPLEGFLCREDFENEFSKIWGLRLKKEIPMWQCFLVFALVPFITLFFLLEDILQFSMFSRRTRHVISLLTAIIAVYSGAFSRFLWYLALISKVTVYGSFLLIIILFSSISLVLSWFGSIYSARARMREEAAELAAGILQTAVGEALLESGRIKKKT